jgi:hypothetical protein
MRPLPTRREVIKTAAVAGTLAALPNVHAAGSDVLRVGLVGCGSRGTGAAAQALAADSNVKLVAMADAFEDRLEESLSHLKNQEKVGSKVEVRPEGRFVGFDAYRNLLAAGVDVVLLCTPPQFRPLHLEAALEAGKHVFAEKPVAVDAPGVRSVLESCALAKSRGLSVVSGLCLRYDNGFRETVKRIHDGAVGDVVTLLANDYRSGRWAKPKQPGWTEMTYQMRNWYNFTWLSGDFNVDRAGVRPDLRPLLGGLRVRRRGEADQQLPPAAAVQERHERPGAGDARPRRHLRAAPGHAHPRGRQE